MQRNTLSLMLVTAATLAVTAGCSRAGDDELSTGSVGGRTGTDHRPVAASRVVAAGTVLDLRSGQRISSASNHVGDAVTATFASAVRTPAGDTVIPAGAVLKGTIARIGESSSANAPGTLALNFTTVTVGAHSYPIDVSVTRMGTHLDRAGVTTEDAAKVAAGAVVGAVAGRVITGNRRGTVIGAGAGAAGGAVVANRTRDRDIVLLGGATISAVLDAPFRRP